MNLLVDILFPSKFAKWRMAEIKSFIDRGDCDILVNKITSYAKINYEVDYSEMCDYFGLDNYNIIIFDEKFNYLNKYNKRINGTKFNCNNGFSYLFTLNSKFELDKYDSIYHIFLSNYVKFNQQFTFPQEKQFIHLYPGGGFSAKEDILKIDKNANIISTQEVTNRYLKSFDYNNFITCYGSTCLLKNEQKNIKPIHEKVLTVCFSNMGNPSQKGAEMYKKVASTFKRTFPKLPVQFISIGNCLNDDNIKNYKPMAQSDLDEFYNKNVDILINAENGSAFNGWPLGIEAALQGVVLITTDNHNSNAKFNYMDSMLFIIKKDDVARACTIIKNLHLDRARLNKMSMAIQQHSFSKFSFENQQKKIFDYMDKIINFKPDTIKIKIKNGMRCYRLVCPEFFAEESVFSIKDTSWKFPFVTIDNVQIIEQDASNLFLTKLKNNEPFSIARYNDGEWSPMLKISYTGNSSTIPHKHPEYNFKDWTLNESGQKYAEDKLLKIIQSKPKYYIGVASQVLNKFHMMKQVSPYLKDLNLIDGGIWARLSINGDLIKYFNEFKNKNVIIVGPDYCKQMNKYFEFQHIITNDYVWDEHDSIHKKIKKTIANMENPVILYCCSYVAKTMIDIFYNTHKNITQLDMGAALCAYCGINIRPWHEFTPV